VFPVKALANGVEWTRADVPVNDSEAGKAEQKKPASAMLGNGTRRRRTGGISNGGN
jgi:hypothetical protein